MNLFFFWVLGNEVSTEQEAKVFDSLDTDFFIVLILGMDFMRTMNRIMIQCHSVNTKEDIV